MEKETLKKWRLLIPGIIIMLVIIPGLTRNIKELKNIDSIFSNFKWSDLFYLGLVVVLGAIYYLLNIRWLLWKHYNKKVQENIKDNIINECGLKMSGNIWIQLYNNESIMNLFYEFIDNDESLKEKAKDVRFNGLIWSSSFDLAIISFCGSIVYSVLSWMLSKSHYLYISVILIWAFLISIMFSSILTKRHIKISNEQLSIIKVKYKNDIDKNIEEIIRSFK